MGEGRIIRGEEGGERREGKEVMKGKMELRETGRGKEREKKGGREGVKGKAKEGGIKSSRAEGKMEEMEMRRRREEEGWENGNGKESEEMEVG
jgi:hypothetical protein